MFGPVSVLNHLSVSLWVTSADLIMLGLATHEPNFTIIREEFKPNKPRPCALCGQMGHELKECQGTAREKQGQVRGQHTHTHTYIQLPATWYVN